MLPYIKVGSLVTAPLRRRQVTGIVVELQQRLEHKLRGKVRPIAKLERDQQLSERQIEVIKKLAAHYGASNAEVAFHALKYSFIPKVQTVRSTEKPTFIQAKTSRRYEEYLKIITRDDGTTFLVLFAQKNFAQEFARIAAKVVGEVVLDNDKSQARRIMQDRLGSGKRIVLVGTIQQAFFPLDSGDCIIVDQPSHIGAKQQQRPFMRLGRIAEIRATTESLRLITGDILPEVGILPKFLRHEWQLQSHPPTAQPLLIFSRQGTRSFLVPGVEDELRTRASVKGKVLIIVLSRGVAPALVCADCAQIIDCANCGRTISVTRSKLKCRYCSHEQAIPSKCPNCNRNNLRPVGEGVESAMSYVRQLVPNVEVEVFSSDQPVFPHRAKIVISTEKIFNVPRAEFDSVFFLSVDRLLSGTEIESAWELMNYILTLPGEKIIQTYLPEHRLWGYAGTGNIKKFFTEELTLRRRYRLPPYSVFFAVVGQSSALESLQRQAKIITDNLAEILPAAEIGLAEYELLTEHHGKIGILTSRLTNRQKETIRETLPPNWHLDIEP